jgi:two-component system NtrC family response regulator
MTEENARIVVVDDDPGLRRQLKWAFSDFTPVECADRGEALQAVRKRQPAVVLLDLGLPPDPDGASEGLTALNEILAVVPETKVIVMTGQKERRHALECVNLGAYDFYRKPIDVDELHLIVRRASQLYALERENRKLQSEAPASDIPGLITTNHSMREVIRQVGQFAKADVSVLITGESGTGKELVANALHSKSKRAQGSYVAINCAAIPENLLESELFGYEKGAFTGAHKSTPGKIEQAHNGTLLLDEIGDMPLSLQGKLLRVLQERTLERVGGRRAIPVDFRLVAATNRDLAAMARDGSFREDLYYRLGEATLRIPPLRERPEDTVLVSQNFLKTWATDQELPVRGFTPDALAAMTQYDWPGNVRELQSRIKRAAVCASGKITADDLGLTADPGSRVPTLKEARRRAEFEAIQMAINQTDGNISEAARLLGVSRPTLYQLMNDHNFKQATGSH